MTKIKFTFGLLLFVAIGITSCEKDKSHRPITLSLADGSGNLNNINCISMTLPGQFPPLMINGGDGDYTITNNSPRHVDYELDGRILTLQSVATGRDTISITDHSGNIFELRVNVSSAIYPLVKTDGMDPAKKSELEKKIVANAPKGVWDLGATSFKKGKVTMAKRYLSNAEDSDYLEYICTAEGEIPSNQRPLTIATQIETWFVMKSDTEEFVLFICQPFIEDGKQMRGYNLIVDVTNKYIGDYPEITRAYEIQTGYLQPDWK